jgi:hypothetical protein
MYVLCTLRTQPSQSICKLQLHILSDARVTPTCVGGWCGDMRAGAACNCFDLTFCPHTNGTHTECIGHILAGGSPTVVGSAVTCVFSLHCAFVFSLHSLFFALFCAPRTRFTFIETMPLKQRCDMTEGLPAGCVDARRIIIINGFLCIIKLTSVATRSCVTLRVT